MKVRKQHERPCRDCPWRRNAPEGWLGSMTAEEWLNAAHAETQIDCHVHVRPPMQCAGSAIYRANVLKRPRFKTILVLPANKEAVFASPTEFLVHHTSPTTRPR